MDPNASILTNMLTFVTDFTLRSIFARYNPYEKAKESIKTDHIDINEVYAFEDVTWDTVFANMKTIQFSDEYSESTQDTAFYIDYTDYIHQIDTDRLISGYGEDAIARTGMICKEFLDLFMTQVFPDLFVSTKSHTDMFKKIGESVGPLIIEAISKNIQSDENGKSELLTLLSKTNDVFDHISADETGLFKMTYASLVKGTEVLICNPEYMQLGDRMISAIKYYVSGASVIIADKVSKSLDPGEFRVIHHMAPGLLDYLPTLISMMISMAMIVSLDKNPLMITLTDRFNKVSTITGNIALYRERAEKFEQMAAELAKFDYEELHTQIIFYDRLSSEISRITDAEELNRYLIDYYRSIEKELPWGNRTIEAHWADQSSRLVFK